MSLGATDVLVIDLDDLASAADPSELSWALARLDVWLVSGERPVTPGWLVVARDPRVELMHCDAMERAAGFRPLTTRLLWRLGGPRGEDIATLVLKREP